MSVKSVSASAVHRDAMTVEEKASPADATRAAAPAEVSQAAEGNVAHAVCVPLGAATVLALTPYPTGMALTVAAPVSVSAGALLVAATFRVAFRSN